MVSFHGCEKQYSCEVCGKEFYLKWRLEKHSSMHENSVKPCKYLKERTACPFEDIGCKFAHEDPEEDERIEDINQSYAYECTFCNINFKTQNDIIVHMSDVHIDKFPHIQRQNDFITF